MGRAWKFGDNISTDQIAPGRYYHLRSNLPELAKHVLEDARKDFATNVRKGDFVVGGRNFGKGSSREHAPLVMKIAGVQAVLATSFARIFYRNCINIGLPAVIIDTEDIADGDELDVNIESGVVTDRTKNLERTFPPMPPVMSRILREGGLAPYIKARGDLVFSEE